LSRTCRSCSRCRASTTRARTKPTSPSSRSCATKSSPAEMPADNPITTDDPREAVRLWFELLDRYCAAVDFDSAEAIFAPDVYSFGTKAAVVSGIEHVRRNQWQ